MTTKYQNYITGDDTFHTVWTVGWYSQTFTPSINHIITSVKLKLHRVGDAPGTLTVSIRAATANLPSGADLCSGTTDGDDITDNTDGEWIEITFTTAAMLLASTMYAIVVHGPADAETLNYIAWHGDNTSPTYVNGTLCVSGDSGDSWTRDSTADEMFEEWGNPGGGSPGGAIYPTEAITRVTNLIHRYNRNTGVYTLEMALGEVTTDFGLPEWLTMPQPAVPEVELPPVVPGGPPTAWPPRPGEVVPRTVICPYCGLEVPWGAPYAEHLRTAHPAPKEFPTYEEQLKYEEWFKKQLEELRRMGWKG